MKRNTLTIIIGGLGTIVALAMLLGMSLMGSLMADARTDKLTGPGVDVFLRTPFPSPGGRVVLEVTARGGSRAGILQLRVRHEGRTLATRAGRGATWGHMITSGKTRGSKTRNVAFDVPEGIAAGKSLPLQVDVAYVVAMSEGAGRFRNKHYRHTVDLEVKVYSAGGRRLARLGLVGRALGLLAAWFLVVWGVAYLFVRDAELHGPDSGSSEDAEFAGIGLLMGLMGGGFLGYWFFARPLMAAWATQATLWAVGLTSLWMVLPVGSAFLWSRRRPKYGRYACAMVAPGGSRVDVGPGGAQGHALDPSEVIQWLHRDLGFRVRSGEHRLQARRGKARLRLRWAGRRLPVHGLLIEATEIQAAVELAHRMAGRVGPLRLSTPHGFTLDIDSARSVDELMLTYGQAMLAEAERLMAGLGSLDALLQQARAGEGQDRQDRKPG